MESTEKQEQMEADLMAFFGELKFPCFYDEVTQVIFDNEGKRLLDVRRWGWVQKHNRGVEMQDAFGAEICAMINHHYSNRK